MQICYVNVRTHIQTFEWSAVLGDRRHYDLFNSNKQKECCLIQWNIHVFCIFIFMNLSCKRAVVKRDSVQFCWIQFLGTVQNESKCNKNVEAPPMRWFCLQGSHVPRNPINNIMCSDECVCVHVCVCYPSVSLQCDWFYCLIQRYGRRGIPLYSRCLLRYGMNDLGGIQKCNHKHKCPSIYPIQVSCFTPRIG